MVVPVSGPIYLDASALVKLYFAEAESDELNRALAGRDDLVISELAITELTSALCRRARRGDLAETVPARVRQEVLGGLAVGQFQQVELRPQTHREAERYLLLQTGAGVVLRGMDALHLALAFESRAAAMLSYDSRLRQAAAAVGLVLCP